MTTRALNFSAGFLACLLLLFTTSACYAQERETAAIENALLWEIKASRGQTSYLFGTIHSEDPRILALPRVVKGAFENSNTFIMEVILTPQVAQDYLQVAFFQDGTQLQTLVSEQQYSQIKRYLPLPEELLQRMKPWNVYTMLVMPQNSGQFLDLKLYGQAQAAGKYVAGLETASEQFTALDSLPIEQQLEILTETLNQIDEIPALLEQMHQLYLNRDLQAMVALSDETMPQDRDTVEQFNYNLITSRNQRMAKRMQAHLQLGSAFIAVGALHLPGDEGIVNLLRQAGYKVSPLY